MKNFLLLLVIFPCIALKLIAQGPTLTSANSTFVVGENFLIQPVKVANVNDLSGGANQTWDYSSVIDSGGIVGVQAVTPASTPFADSFPSSNLAIKTLNDSVYIYYNSQTNELSQLGITTADSTTIRYTIPKVYLSYPFSYNSFFTDSVVLESSEFGVLFRGKDSLTGDGYGTLKTPGHIYSDVLRIKYIENTTYSKDTLGILTTINLRGIAYIYFTPGTHAPLFSNGTTQSRTTLSILGIPFFDTTTYVKNVSYLQDVMLPLSFTSFNASLNNNQVLLQWQTAQEINTSHFNVQRSLTDNNFTNIAEMKTTGNASSISNYNYTDQDFVKTSVPPSVFYRIKETDKDGKEFYSEVKVVHGSEVKVSLYPNPVTNYINFKGGGMADAISIFDAKGNLVKQFNNYQLSQPVNVSGFSKGTYFIKIKIADKTTITTIIKQ